MSPTGSLEFDASRLREVFDALREGVQVLSPEWRYLYVNDAVAKQAHRRPDELIGRTMTECFPGIDQTPMFAVLRRCLEARRAENYQSEFEYEDGARAQFELRIQPCKEGLTVLSLEITERLRLESMLRQSEKLRALGQLAASVAHDLKNIFNPIGLQARLASHHVSAESHLVTDALAQIERAVRTGSGLVEQLRSFSQQEKDQAAEPTDLSDALEKAIDLCKPRLKEQPGVQLKAAASSAPPVLVRSPGLVAAIVNLVVNALDAMSASGTITASTGAAEGGGWIEVADTGPGMPPEVQRRAFEPFFTTKQHGTGLGLASLYGFTQRHGGRVTLDTAPGRGTRIRLWFPAASAAPSHAASTAPATRRRLLLVEDEPSAREALEALLGEEGFTVLAAGDGEQALARLAEFRPDVLLVDLRMPGISGAVVARRARQWRSRLPVVVMSGAEASNVEVAELLKEPLTEHLAKPIDMDRLLVTLARVLEESAAQPAAAAS